MLATLFVWYGGLLVALYNYNGLVAPGLRLHNFWVIYTRVVLCSVCVPCSSSVHRAPGKKATVPIDKVLVRPGQESNSRPTSTEADTLATLWLEPVIRDLFIEENHALKTCLYLD